MIARVLALVVTLAAAAFSPATAHEVRPALLQLTETDAGGEFDVLWRVPARGDRVLPLRPRLPAACRDVAAPSASLGEGFQDRRWRVACTGGLAGELIALDGLERTLTDALVRVDYRDGGEEVHRLSPESPAVTLAGARRFWRVAGAYLNLGVEHILLGIDHLLFVAALMMLVGSWRRLVGTVTAFTLAHSITLAGATLGFLTAPRGFIEAAIALSIVFVAGEVVHHRRGKASLTAQQPWLVAFAFGLLHGFGFAGALHEVGLPAHAIPAALLFFNVGVEVGQILFIAVLAGLVAGWRRWAAPPSGWSLALPAYAIGTIAAFWTVERVVGFWS